MVKASIIIDKLFSFIKEKGPQSSIDLCKELLSDSFAEAVKEENFYKLPTNEINDILSRYLQSDVKHDARAISKLIRKVSMTDQQGGLLLLNLVKLKNPSIEECVKIISSVSGCQICKQLGELERNYEAELKRKDEEIEKLKKGNTSDVFVSFPNGKTKYYNFPREATARELKSLVLKDYNQPTAEESDISLKSHELTLSDDTLISGDWRKKGNVLRMNLIKEDLQISIKSPTGMQLTIITNQFDYIEDIKMRIQEKQCIPIDQQRLIYKGQTLEDENTLKYYQVPNFAVFHLILVLKG